MIIKWAEQWKEMVAWAAGGICLVILCMLATFPYGALQTRLLTELTRVTGMEIRVTDWTIDFPFGLEWSGVTLSRSDWGPIQLAALQAKIGVMSALSGDLELEIAAHQDDAPASHAGLAKATLSASSFSMTHPITLHGQLQRVDLSKLLRQYVTHGLLNGQLTHRLDPNPTPGTALKGEGTWEANATDLTVDQIPLGNGRILSLSFNKVSAGLVCRDSVCDVTELQGDGVDGSFNGGGTITIQHPMQYSQVALTVTLIPGAGFASKAGALGLPSPPPGTPITVKVLGTLAQARIAL